MHHFQGHYNEKSWKKIESLTEEEILDTINHKNVSGIFLKDFNFKELLGDIKYDEHENIIGELIINKDNQRQTTKQTPFSKFCSFLLHNMFQPSGPDHMPHSTELILSQPSHNSNTGAGAVEMKFFTTVNVTAVKLFGTATRGEKVKILLFIILNKDSL